MACSGNKDLLLDCINKKTMFLSCLFSKQYFKTSFKQLTIWTFFAFYCQLPKHNTSITVHTRYSSTHLLDVEFTFMFAPFSYFKA